jgi:hypothetical protein
MEESMKYTFSSFIVLFFLLAACSAPAPSATGSLEPEANYWQQLGSTVGTGGLPALASDGTSNTIAFSELSGSVYNIRVKKWSGTNWANVGSALSGSSAASSNAFYPSIALNSSGNPVVAWHEFDGSSRNIYVKRFDGSTWVNVGTGVLSAVSGAGTDAHQPSLALDSAGNPVVAWFEFNGLISNIYVQRYNGSSWVSVGTGVLNATGNVANSPSLALNSSGNPTVAWSENRGNPNENEIQVFRYNGSSWVNVGSALHGSSNSDNLASEPSLALDSAGNPTVAWFEDDGTAFNIYVKRHNGSTWVNVGTGVLNISGIQAIYPSLLLDSSGNPVVSWMDYDGTSYNLRVQKFNGTTWTNLGTLPLDTSLANFTYYPALSISNDKISVAWQEGAGEASDNIYVKQFQTNAWQPFGDALDTSLGQSATSSSITRKSNNTPVVAWQENDGSSDNVYVKEWSGTAWTALGSALDRNLADDAQTPAIAMQSNNRPVVAWQENNNIYVRRWSGSSWLNIGAALDTVLSNSAVTPSLALDSSNLAVVAFVENGNLLVKKANGVLSTSIWTSPYGTTPLDITLSNTVSRPSLALKSDGHPIVAWSESDGNIYAKEWNGTSWAALGGAIDTTVANNAKDVVLAIRSDNRPVVAWEEVGNIYVKQWSGSTWTSIGGVVDRVPANQALRPSLDLRSDNNPIVTWQEGSTNYNIYVKRWTGTTWANVGTALDKTPSRTAQRPVVVIKTNNQPIVAWDESDGSSENVYVKQF